MTYKYKSEVIYKIRMQHEFYKYKRRVKRIPFYKIDYLFRLTTSLAGLHEGGAAWK